MLALICRQFMPPALYRLCHCNFGPHPQRTTFAESKPTESTWKSWLARDV